MGSISVICLVHKKIKLILSPSRLTFFSLKKHFVQRAAHLPGGGTAAALAAVCMCSYIYLLERKRERGVLSCSFVTKQGKYRLIHAIEPGWWRPARVNRKGLALSKQVHLRHWGIKFFWRRVFQWASAQKHRNLWNKGPSALINWERLIQCNSPNERNSLPQNKKKFIVYLLSCHSRHAWLSVLCRTLKKI